MDNKNDINKELEEISPFLSDLEKKSGFQIPENYFNQLEDDLWNQFRSDQQPIKTTLRQPNWIDQILNSLSGLLQPRLALQLASVAMLVIAGVLILYQMQPSNSEIAFDVSDEELNTYIAAHIDDFDEEMLLEYGFSEDDFASISSDLLEDETLDDYLNDVLDELDDEALEELL